MGEVSSLISGFNKLITALTRYLDPAQINLVDLDEVPLEKSSRSIHATLRPRAAASRAAIYIKNIGEIQINRESYLNNQSICTNQKTINIQKVNIIDGCTTKTSCAGGTSTNN